MNRQALGTSVAALTFATALLVEMRRGQSRWKDLGLERLLRKRGPQPARHAVARLEQPEAVLVQSVVFAAAAAKRHPRAACAIVAAPLLALAVTSIIKAAVDRPRPLSHLLRRKGLQSFPSSHTAGKMALAWMIALAFPSSKRTRIGVAALAAVDVALVAAARISDGAHWPTDTLAGAAIGIAAAESIAALAGPRGS